MRFERGLRNIWAKCNVKLIQREGVASCIMNGIEKYIIMAKECCWFTIESSYFEYSWKRHKSTE